jgi:hypothetical protein
MVTGMVSCIIRRVSLTNNRVRGEDREEHFVSDLTPRIGFLGSQGRRLMCVNKELNQ